VARRRESAVSEATTHRLSLVLRALRLLDAEGTPTVSSRLLEERFGLNSAQVRKDLARLGGFGVRGVGYHVPELRDCLQRQMGLDRENRIVIVGAGNLGQALADARNFNSEGFRVAALFDSDPRKIGTATRTGVPILEAAAMRQVLPGMKPRIGVIAVPADQAPASARALAEAGVRALLNFAPATIGPVPGAVVKNADLTLFLESLAFQLAATAATTLAAP
jgi:redox-sensing transcriptional repressor